MTERRNFFCRCGKHLPYRRNRHCGPACARKAQRAAWRAYRKSAKGKASRKEYERNNQKALRKRAAAYRLKRYALEEARERGWPVELVLIEWRA